MKTLMIILIVLLIINIITKALDIYADWKSYKAIQDWENDNEEMFERMIHGEDDEPVLPAIPPEDYSGSISDWMIGLQEISNYDTASGEWYGDYLLTKAEYAQLLDRCEGR